MNELNELVLNELEEKTTKNKDDVIKELDKFQKDSTLIGARTWKSVIKINDNKKRNNIIFTNDGLKDFSSNTNLTNLSLLYKSYIQKIISNYGISELNRKRTILYNAEIIDNYLLREKEDALNEDKNSDNINIFSIIKDKILEAKGEILKCLENSTNKLETKYDNYINNIKKILIEKESKLSQITKGSSNTYSLMDYANDNIFKPIDDILEIHYYIFSCINDLLNLLDSFLDQSNLVNQKKPIESFLNNNSNEILNCWLLNKFDYNRINLSNIISNRDLSDLFSSYFSKMNNNENSNITLQKDDNGNLPLEIELLNKNINKVRKIKFIGLETDDMIKIEGEIKKDTKNERYNKNISEAKNARSLSIINCNLQQKNPFQISFPILKVFKLKNTFLETSYIFSYILNKTNFLTKIHLEKINLTDNDLRIFFQLLSQKQEIQNSLKSLSFKGNILTKINEDNFNIEDFPLKNLEYLNFSKNNIYEFSEKIFKYLPELKLIELTDNNFSNRNFFDIIKNGGKNFKFLALMSDNIFIHNNNSNNIEYIKYITQNLSTFQNKIKTISFRLLFNIGNVSYISKLKISPAIKVSLSKLDLSFCGLDEEILIYFFKNNYGLLNLEILNLSNNNITDKIFKLMNEIKSENLLEKLKVMDLSCNNINLGELDDLKNLDNFLENHRKLDKLKLQYTNFLEGFQNLIKNPGNKEDINIIKSKLTSKNCMIILETGLNNIMTQLLSSILSFKDKTY